MCNCISEATGRHEKFWWRIPPSCLKRNSRNCWLTLTSPSGADCPLWGRRRRRRRKVVSGQGKEGWGQIKREGGQVDIMIRKYQFWMVFFFEGHYLDFIMQKENWTNMCFFFLQISSQDLLLSQPKHGSWFPKKKLKSVIKMKRIEMFIIVRCLLVLQTQSEVIQGTLKYQYYQK